ncbi:hypothetical protein BKA65DRAFT_385642 [Rhexocercosporidium sp. MPI-PUGE-AT-0058]|nr:hypothetical protein BKA65DRAFT_385642 [Rhexocercosporidium sp. MPI-PUGE-AT-0058]
MASNPPPRNRLPTQAQPQHDSPIRAPYPVHTFASENSQSRAGNTPNLYHSSNSIHTTPQQSPYVPNTPINDGLPSPDRGQNGSVSESAAGQAKRTRTRPTKSCERCRSKKLRCDREYPCGSCKKGGKNGHDCSYRDGWEPEEKEEGHVAKKARVGDVGLGMGGGSLGVVEKMVRISEGMSGAAYIPHSSSAPGGGAPDGRSSIAAPPGTGPRTAGGNLHASYSTLGRLDIKGQRSRYIAPGDKMSIMDHFEDSKKFITNGFNDPTMVGLMRELSGFQKTLLPKRPKADTRLAIPQDPHLLKTEMFRAIPDGFVFGAVQKKLFLNWETIQRVLHIPSFSKECEVVAAAQISGASNVPSHLGDWVLPQILAATAIVSRLDDSTFKHFTAGQISQDQITSNIHLAKTWLDGLHGKANVCIHTLQTRTLLLLAQELNLSSTQDLWMDSSTLVRWALSMGLHQDPEAYPDMSKLDKEMRRKLWTTIVELDSQFSLIAGMPAAITSSNFNIRALINVDNSELTETMFEYPMGKAETVWTHAMPQIALSASLKDRLNVTNWLGGHLNLEQDALDLMSYASVLEKALRSLPQQYRETSGAANVNNKRIDRFFTSIMLDMAIRRPLLALYRTVVFSQQSDLFPEARRGALRCSLVILSHLDALDPAIADLSIVKSRDYLNMFHILCKKDIVQAALLLCHEIRYFDKSPLSAVAPNDFGHHEQSFPQTKHSLTRVVENTLNSLLSRLGDFGSDLKDILPLSVVLQSVRAEGTPEEMREVMHRGAERVLTACRKALPTVQQPTFEKVGTNIT